MLLIRQKKQSNQLLKCYNNMKYLKLYEDFNQNNINDILEDIKWIMIEVSEDVELISYALDGDLVTYNIPNYDENDLKVANKRLYDIGYTLLNYVVRGKCLIINKDLLDLSKFDNDVDEIPFPELDAVDFSNIQKELLLKHFEKTPNLIGVDTNVFLLSTNECYNYLSEFLGKDGISKKLHELLDKKYHIRDGGYDFDFTLENIEKDGDEFILKVYIFDEGIVEIIHSGDVMNIIDAITDKEIGWEIKSEMEESIVKFLHRYVGNNNDIATIEIGY